LNEAISIIEYGVGNGIMKIEGSTCGTDRNSAIDINTIKN